MKNKHWVLDASMGCSGGAFTFCPIEGDIDGDFQVITGMNFIGVPPVGSQVVAIIHPDGQPAVELFCEQYKDEIAAFKAAHVAEYQGKLGAD